MKKLKFEDQSKNWKIWDKKSAIERTFQRVQKTLPEMESAKQLLKILKPIYEKGDKVLDFGCAAGHFYHTLKRLDKNIIYYGFDSTKRYIEFGKKFFKKNKNINFEIQSLLLPKKKNSDRFDIAYCINVLHHLPSIDLALKSLLSATKKYCIIRTLISDNTHLSRFYYSDKTDKKGNLSTFQFQNTYSYNLIKKKIKKICKYKKISFLEDRYNFNKINKEFKKDKKNYPGITRSLNNIQLSGSKIFQWRWIVIEK